VLRTVRLFGAGLGLLTAVTLVIAQFQTFADTTIGAILSAGWLVAWTVLGYTLLPYLTVIPARSALRAVTELSTAEFVASVAGLIVGSLLGLLIGIPFSSMEEPGGTWVRFAILLFFALAMTAFTVVKRHDLLVAARSVGIIPSPGIGDGKPGDPHIVVDSSAIIDGRMADIAASGFLYGTLVVPRFVLDEVQRLADSADNLKRGRGRRGLEILAQMRKSSVTAVRVVDDDIPGVTEVDSKLVALALQYSKAIITTDFNLNRIAELQGVRVLNVNSLANAVKTRLVPGDSIRIRVISVGKEQNQGVGYLDDGTMVVIEGGADAVDTDLDVVVSRELQTVAGRMVFAVPKRG
jgi:uncharacterized protein YacL